MGGVPMKSRPAAARAPSSGPVQDARRVLCVWAEELARSREHMIASTENAA
jgi:hypothetical protein